MVVHAELTRSFDAAPGELIALMHDADGAFVRRFHEEMGAASAGPGPEPGGVRVTPWRRLAEEGAEGCSVFERVANA